jgi:OHCU decarboxylase
MSTSLAQLNKLSAHEAQAEFLKCCGSQNWARAMAAARPFPGPEDLFERADATWRSLSEPDWLEAFRAHPKIGEKKAAATQSEQARSWSAQEQSGTATASGDTMTALAAANEAYERRFGFIFIVCATGKTSEEMLTMLNQRLANDPETELRIAADEQLKITRLRLEKMLNQ